MGYFRLFLALSVVYSHVVGEVWGLNTGDMAVLSFLVIAGYTNTLLINKYYAQPAQWKWFYFDKLVRIYPLYLFYLVATLIFIHATGSFDSFNRTQTPLAWLLNFLLFPLDYYEFVPTLTHGLYIPQAWTLGLELTFYLVLPLVLAAALRVQAMVVAGSVVVAGLALFGVINSLTYGYHLLPGVLFVFLAGAAIASPVAWRWTPHVAVAVGAFGVLCCLVSPAIAAMPHNREVMGGTIIGVIAIAALSRFRLGRLDALAGNLSYGVYLNHWLLLMIGHAIGTPHWAIFVAAVALAAVTYFGVEKPVIAWRHRFRQVHLGPRRAAPAPAGPAM